MEYARCPCIDQSPPGPAQLEATVGSPQLHILEGLSLYLEALMNALEHADSKVGVVVIPLNPL